MSSIERVLQKIRDFDWPKRAGDVPTAAQRLLDDDPEQRSDALMDLQLDLADQDVIDGLTARAFPLLAELGTHQDNPGGPALVRWMVDLVLDDHCEWLGEGFDPNQDPARELLAGRAGMHTRACYAALVDAREAFVEMTRRDSPEVRAVGAFALAWLGEVRDELIRPLRQVLASEQDASVRASLLAALGHLGRHGDDEGVRRALDDAGQDGDPDVALAAMWGAIALHGTGPLPSSLVEGLIDALKGPDEMQWGEGYPWALRNHAAILRQLRRGLEGEHGEIIAAALLAAVGRGSDKGQPAALTLGRHLFGRDVDLSSITVDQRALLDVLVEQPWVEETPVLGDLRLPPLDDLRAVLGKDRLGPASALDTAVVMVGDEGTLREFWKRAASSGAPPPDAVVALILDGPFDRWACLFEGQLLDPRPTLPGQAVEGDPIAPRLLDAILDRQDPLAAWRGLEAFAHRAVSDRASLPRPLDTTRGLWRAIVEAATRLRPAAVSDGGLDPLLELLLAYDAELDRRESKIIRAYLATLTDDEREACVLALMVNGSGSGPASHHGHRYADAASTPRVSEAALANMEATVRQGWFGRMNLRTRKQRAEAKAKTASRWAPVLHECSIPRVAELAREPMVVGKHDDRDLFVYLLRELGPLAAAELVQLLFDGKKAIRKLALEALEALDPAAVSPHLGPLRRSKKKEHREALEVLG